MPTSLVATHRINFPIVVDGLTHHTRQYLKVVAGSGPSGYDGVLRDGTLGVDTTDLADAFYTIMAPWFNSTKTTFGQPTLERFSAGAWLPLVTLLTTTTPSASDTYTKGGQLTLSLRDTDFHKVRVVLMEPGAAAGIKEIPPAAGRSADLFAWYDGPIALTHTNGWNWVVGRSNLYIGSAVSIVTDLNDRVRRDRGTA